MKRRQILFAVALATLVVGAAGRPAECGGPIYVNRDGRPFVWDNTRPIRYTVDPGNLGRFSNALANQWIAAAFQRWSSVEGVSISVQATSPFNVDVTGRNVLQVLDTLPRDVNLIILDTDGSALEALGIEASGVTEISGVDFRTGKLTQAFVILNGGVSRQVTADWMQGTVEHEIGHFLGLTHSQLNPQVTHDGNPDNDALATRMSYDDGPNNKPGLHLEDRAWLAALYPKADAPKTTGTIRGRLLLPDGATGIQGGQLVARKVGDEEATAVSGISGFRYRFGPLGSRDVALQGVFELPGLPEGEYRLSLEPLARSPEVSPRRANLPEKRFWRQGAAPTASSQEATTIRVTAGAVSEGIDFVVEGPAPSSALQELEPNDVPELAVTTTLPALIQGRVGPQDAGVWPATLDDGSEDAVEDWYRIVVSRRTLLSIRLDAANRAADLNLFFAIGFDFSPVPAFLIPSDDPGGATETIQFEVPKGTYFIGVSSFDSDANPTTDYRLTMNALPISDPVVVPGPRVTFATFSHLTTNSIRVQFETDTDANAVLLAGRPEREFGSVALTRGHAIEVPGLPQGQANFVEIFTRDAAGGLTYLPLGVQSPSPATGRVPFLVAGLWQTMEEDEKGAEYSVVARLTNFGNAVAANAQLTRLGLPSGWRFVVPPTLPLDLGPIGSGASTPILLRVERTSADAQPLDLSIQGTYATVDGSLRAFGR